MGTTKKDEQYRARIKDNDLVHAERLQKRINSSQVASVSSNSKWFKVFEDLSEAVDHELEVELKFLLKDEPDKINYFFSSMFEQEYFEGMYGSSWYKEIEWIKISVPLNIKFKYEVDFEAGNDSFVVYGYRVGHS